MGHADLEIGQAKHSELTTPPVPPRQVPRALHKNLVHVQKVSSPPKARPIEQLSAQLNRKHVDGQSVTMPRARVFAKRRSWIASGTRSGSGGSCILDPSIRSPHISTYCCPISLTPLEELER